VQEVVVELPETTALGSTLGPAHDHRHDVVKAANVAPGGPTIATMSSRLPTWRPEALADAKEVETLCSQVAVDILYLLKIIAGGMAVERCRVSFELSEI
jgi:hypothetical protein